MNFMKKILVQTNSTATDSNSIQTQQNASNQLTKNQIDSNQLVSNESNQLTNQQQLQLNQNKSICKQQIELEKQLEKQRILREYRQSSAARSQEINTNESMMNDDLIRTIKTKTRGLSLCAAGDKQNTQDIGLTLLNKLFLTIKTEHQKLIELYGQKGPTKYDQYGQKCKQELEKNIYKLLPLFMKTFNCSINETMPEMRLSTSMQSFNLSTGYSSSNTNRIAIQKNVDLFEQFHDLPCFAQIISRLMVNEIRKRASQKTTQEASQSVIKFLELSNLNKQSDKLDPLETNDDDENNNNGWILLSTLNFLVCNCSSNLIPVMAAVNLPSTLVKCLYLFFDLPEPQSLPKDSYQNESIDQDEQQTFRNMYSSQLVSSISLSKITLDDIQNDLDRRLLLKKVFSQLLSRLSVHQNSIDDLTKKDDLERLFNSITQWCSNRFNIIWREIAAEVIINMTKYKYMNLEYISEKRCITTCIENMSKMFELNKASIREICEMWCTLIDFFVEIMNCNQSQSDSNSIGDNQIYSKQFLSALLTEFKQANGYNLLVNFIIKLDVEIVYKPDQESLQLMHKLISLITLFCKVGTNELKPKPCLDQVFIMDGFNMPKPTIKNCVRNLQAFNIFVSLWPNTKSEEIQDFILAALITIYKSDKANYFILDSHNTLAQFAEQLYTKPLHVQEKFFNILEYIIFELRYIPCKELISVEILLKENHSYECNVLYLKSLLSIIKFNVLFKEVYREVGIFDILIQLLINKMNRILDGQFDKDFKLKEQTHLSDLLIEIVHNMLIGSNQENCKLFEKLGATKLIYRILCSIDQYKNKEHKSITKQMKRSSYIIIQQLIGFSSGEERLTLILDILHAASDYTTDLEINLTNRSNKRKTKRNKDQSVDEDELKKELIDYITKLKVVDKFKIKIRLLKLLFNILKDSHRCRAIFRKCGGFIYIISILVSMEGYFKRDGKLPDEIEQVGWKKVLTLLKLVFSILTISTRFEPANAKFIANEIGSASLSDSVRLLGCFTQELSLQDDLDEVTKEQNKISKLSNEEKNEFYEKCIFQDYFQIDDNKPWSTEQIVCLVMKLMYEMSLDQIEKNKTLVFMDKQKSISSALHSSSNQRQSKSSRPCSVATSSRQSSCSLTIDYYSDYFVNNNLIIHPTVIVSIFQLIPSIQSISLRKFILNNLIGSLIDLERNKQVLCSVNFLNELLSKRFNYALTNTDHSLHSSLQKIFIQLAAQQINSQNLRNYIRLVRPLGGLFYDDFQMQQKKKQNLEKLTSSCHSFSLSIVERLKTSSHLPLVTIKTLSLITIKNYRQEANYVNPLSVTNTSNIQSNQQMQQLSQSDLVEKIIFQQPPFVEFDLNQEGFSSIFLPSIAPVNLNTITTNSINFLNQNLITNAILNTTTDNQQNQLQLNGGIGMGERLFPPQNALTYLTWFCIEQFPGQIYSNPSTPTPNHPESCSPSPTPYDQSNKELLTKDPNNIRLLTIVRSSKNGKEYCALQIQISPKDKCLIISTQEIPFPEQNDVPMNQDANAKIFHPNLFTTGKWHFLVIVLGRALLKNSTCTVYLDGQFLASQKLNYINNFVGQSGVLTNLNNSQSNAAYVNAFIGVSPKLRKRINIVWKQGPCHLVEDNLSQNWISFIYGLGPSYVGSFQCSNQQNQLTNLSTNSHSTNQTQSQATNNLNVLNQIHMQPIPEEKIIFGLNAKANSSMTLAKLRRVYSRSDCKQLAELLSLSIHENATPITVFHNSAGHLIGNARTLGGFLVGYIGCRFFLPKSITNTISEIGGCTLLLSIISNSNQEDLFVNAMKLFVVMMNSGNRKLHDEIKHVNGYQILVVILRKKKNLLNCDIFNSIVRLTCELETTEDLNNFLQSRDTFGKLNNNVIHIKEQNAFKELIIEHMDLWWHDELILKGLLDLFNDLIDNQRYRQKNLKKLRELGLLNKILFCLWILKLKDQHLMHLTRKLLFNLLNQTKRQGDILHFGQFICVYLQINDQDPANADQIELRNSLLKIVMHLLTKNNSQINAMTQESFVSMLGFDWFLLFIRNSNLSKETIILGLVNLMILISNPSLYVKFREATSNGGWLKHSRSQNGQIKCNFTKEDESLSMNDVKMLGMNVINLGGNITSTIETNLSNLNNLTLENLNESITSNILDRDEGTCNETLSKTTDVINLLALKKIETSLFLIPGFQHLDWLLLNHLYEPRIYLILFQCLLGEFQQFNSALLETIEKFDVLSCEQFKQSLNLIESNVINKQQTTKTSTFFVSDIAISISNLINHMLWNRLRLKFMDCKFKNDDENEDENKTNQETRKVEKLSDQQQIDFNSDYPLILMQTLIIIYKTKKDFQTYCQNSPEFIFDLSQLLTKQMHYKRVENFEEIISKDDFLNEFRTTTINFMIKMIIVDTLISSNKPINRIQLVIMEQFLDTFQHCLLTQKEILSKLIAHLNEIVESQAELQNFISIHIPSQSPRPVKINIALNNIIAFISILADKIWESDSYTNESTEIFEFCLNYLHQIDLESIELPPNARIMQSEELNRLFKSTNRIVLYLLSRPILGMAERMSIIDFLNKIIQNRKVLFSPLNNDSTFFVCLTYCLMQFIDQEHITLCSNKKTKSTWNVINENLNSINQNVSIDEEVESCDHKMVSGKKSVQRQQSNLSDDDEGALLIVSNANKIWLEMFAMRRQMIEDALKIKLKQNLGNASFASNAEIADLKKIKPNIFEACLKVWNSFIENERQIRILKAKCKKNLIQTKSLGTGNLTNSGSNLGDGSNNFTLNNFAAVGERLTNINKLSKVVGSSAGLMSKLVINTVSSTIKKDTFKTGSSISLDQQIGGQVNKQLAIPLWKLMEKNQVIRITDLHLNLIIETVQFNYKNKIQKNQHLIKYVLEDWNNIEFEILLRERAIFECPNFECRKLTKWMLDMTEGPNRMRKKLIRNDLFYLMYPYRPEMDSNSPKNLKQIKFKSPISWDSIEYHKRGMYQFNSRNTSMNSSLENLNSSDEDAYLQSISMITSSMANLSSDQNLNKSMYSEEMNSSFDETKDEQKEPLSNKLSTTHISESALESAEIEQLESQSLIRLLEEGEKISQIFKCARVLGLDNSEGLMLFGKENFYLIDGFTILKNNEIRDLDTLPVHLQDPVVPNCNTPTNMSKESSSDTQTKRKLASTQSSGGRTSGALIQMNSIRNITKKVCMKFAYEDIKEVHKRRYLLQPIALEIFSLDGRNSLLVFTRKQRNKIYTKLLSLAPNINDNAQESLAGQKRNVNVESGSGNLLSGINFFSETSVVQRWVRGEISNFTYLICLNNLGGRTYNDLMQYPIFPWIIADYHSETLNLNDKATFRDLSKPMGAQTEQRLKQFLSRYKEFDCIQETPYFYGTFYSSAMIVASYLVRMEPFTQHFLNLQGGHFDLADRLFHSIEEAWLSASQNNMSDVKELIPEFFYLPEFLVNSNRFDLGVKQNGTVLNDVILPPWAKGDPKEFIRLNRLALESDYVSAHLNEWIDLIFGYKQQGQAAIDNVNLFHHLFYEGEVDIYTIDDPVKKKAIIGFINNFGQIAPQLFKKAHPVKKAYVRSGTITSTSSNTFFGSNIQINQLNSMNSLSTPPLTANTIGGQNIQQSSTPTSNPNSITPLTPLFSSMLGGSSSSNISNQQSLLACDRLIMHNLLNLVQTNHIIKELRGSVGQIIQQEKNILAVEQNKVLIPPQFNKYVAFGYADGSIRIGNYESDRAFSIFESDLLPCTDEILCCTVANSRTMITGGTNSVISVYRLKNKLSKIELLQNLYGHSEAITCLAASSAFGILVSGSRDRTCIIWDLNKLAFVRQLGAEYLEQTNEIKEKLKFVNIGSQQRGDNLNFKSFQKTGTEMSENNQNQFNIFSAPISAICINDLNGDISTCCNTQIFIWTINGDLLACVDIFNYQYSNIHCENRLTSMMNAPSNVQILCCTFSLYKEYDENNIFVVGCSDGTIRIYSMRYIQILIDENEMDTSFGNVNITDNISQESVDELINQVNELTNRDDDETPINSKPNNRKHLIRSEECETKNEPNDENLMIINKDEMVRRMSLITVQTESQIQDDESDDEDNKRMDYYQSNQIMDRETNGIKRLERKSTKRKNRAHCPKLDISGTLMIDSPNRDHLGQNDQKLKPGFKWSRQLILENELTIADKVAISSIAISKDNRTLFVGDVKGRLLSFVVANTVHTPQSQTQSQTQSPLLIPKLMNDSNQFNCTKCSIQFNERDRKVRCSNCSKFVCTKCFKMFKFSSTQHYKVCTDCFGLLTNSK